MSFKNIARETLTILDRGHYRAPSGHRVYIAKAQREAVEGTRLLRPFELEDLLARRIRRQQRVKTALSVTSEKTQEAARRLVQDEDVDDLVALNFASARRVGGGFLRDRRAQEEDMARSSGIFRCLETQPAYYESNRACSSPLYTDHMIYSPGVPWFRGSNEELLECAFSASVITAPAPNAREYQKISSGSNEAILDVLVRRASYVLALAESRGHRTLLLGAWGCGVFGCPADEVAGVFVALLRSRRFKGCFDRVVFAVYDPSRSQSIFRAFRSRVPS